MTNSANRTMLRNFDGRDVRKTKVGQTVLRAAIAGAVLFMLFRTLSRADLAGVGTMIAESGPVVFLGLVPVAAMMAIDTFVQKTLLDGIGQSPRYLRLYLVRLVTEAFSTSLPAGVVVAESMGPLLLRRHAGVSIDAAIVANAAKRWLTIRAHGVYLALSAVIGYATLARISSKAGWGIALSVLVATLAVVLLVMSAGIGAMLNGRAWPQRLAARLRSLPSVRWRRWLDRRGESIAAIDGRFARLTADKQRLALSTTLLLTSWLVESVETWVLLRLLGAPIEFAEVIAFEATLSFVRSAAFFVPAGLGVQDLGYIAFLSALGVPNAATLSAAFVVSKRAKEALWVLTGWLLAGGLTLWRARIDAAPLALTEEALS